MPKPGKNFTGSSAGVIMRTRKSTRDDALATQGGIPAAPPARNKARSTHVPITGDVTGTRDLRDTLRERRGRKRPQTTVTSDEMENLSLAVRKRTMELDQEEEALRTKLRLIEIQRERLSLGPNSTAVQVHRGEGNSSSSGSSSESTPALVGSQIITTSSLSQALTEALVAVRDSSVRPSDHSVWNRMSDKELPTFSGNELEWLPFKNAFELSTELGRYSDRENAGRLYKCLKGDARRAVETLMMTSTNARDIMEVLDLKYGNKEEIMRKIVDGMRRLLKLNQSQTDLVSFATNVRNGTAAIETLNHVGYLYNPDLAREIVAKLPSAMIYRYNDYVARYPDAPCVKRVADFLYQEATIANRAGTSRLSYQPRRETTDRSKGTSTTVNVTTRTSRSTCADCNEQTHAVGSCVKFRSMSLRDRWDFVRSKRLCFKCLIPGHRHQECTTEGCDIEGCAAPHHTQLHFTRRRVHATREPEDATI